MTMDNNSLHTYLSQLRCPREGRPDSSSVYWESGEDLFGARHRIDMVWDPESITIFRQTYLPEECEGKENWRLELVKSGNERWQLQLAAGDLLSVKPGEGVTISGCVRAIQSEIKGLGQGAIPGWEERPYRRSSRLLPG